MSDADAAAATRIAFLGDAAEAAAFRLAGVRVWSPAPGDELAAFDAALAQAVLVLVSARLARRLPPAVLEAAFVRLAPLVLIIPEPDTAALEIDPVVRVRRQLSLGMADEPGARSADAAGARSR